MTTTPECPDWCLRAHGHDMDPDPRNGEVRRIHFGQGLKQFETVYPGGRVWRGEVVARVPVQVASAISVGA
jgi:hypothetical protein